LKICIQFSDGFRTAFPALELDSRDVFQLNARGGFDSHSRITIPMPPRRKLDLEKIHASLNVS